MCIYHFVSVDRTYLYVAMCKLCDDDCMCGNVAVKVPRPQSMLVVTMLRPVSFSLARRISLVFISVRCRMFRARLSIVTIKHVFISIFEIRCAIHLLLILQDFRE